MSGWFGIQGKVVDKNNGILTVDLDFIILICKVI